MIGWVLLKDFLFTLLYKSFFYVLFRWFYMFLWDFYDPGINPAVLVVTFMYYLIAFIYQLAGVNINAM